MTVRDLSGVFTQWLEYPSVPWERREDPDDKTSPLIAGVSTYRVKSPDSIEGLKLTALANLGIAAAAGATLTPADRASLRLDDDQEPDFYKRVLGDAYEQMQTDGVPWLVLKAIAEDALLFFGMSEEAADLILSRRRAGSSGEAPAGATRPSPTSTSRTARKTAGSGSKRASTGTRARTRSRTSTSSSRKTPTGEADSAAS